LNKFFNKYSKYSNSILRIGIGLVFLYFGLNQIFNSESFIGYLPNWVLLNGISNSLIILTGIFNLIVSISFLLGYKLRIFAILASLHLFFVIISIGYVDSAVRDFGILIATIVIGLNNKK
jgi:uncharacterized membrane protein YphA (DoxX/SURF4 family)